MCLTISLPSPEPEVVDEGDEGAISPQEVPVVIQTKIDADLVTASSGLLHAHLLDY